MMMIIIIIIMIIIIINTVNMEYKNKVIPVITGATGTISKLFRKYLNHIPEKQEIKELY